MKNHITYLYVVHYGQMLVLQRPAITSARIARHSTRAVDLTFDFPCVPHHRADSMEQWVRLSYAFLKVMPTHFALGEPESPNGYTTVLADTQQRRFKAQPLEEKNGSESLGRVCVPMRRAGIGSQCTSNARTGAARLTLSLPMQPHHASGRRRNDQCPCQRSKPSRLFADRTCWPPFAHTIILQRDW